MTARKCLCFFIYLLFCISCAKQGVPSGGPKDSIPPKLISSFPKQRQLNFKGKEIQMTFSENVFVNNPREQVIITPSVGKDFDATAKNKILTLKFENELKDSTTYTLSFRDAVKDITEKNSVQNLKLAFSTGPFIDSLSLEGTVFDLLKDKEVKDATVALYQNVDTFNIFKHKPTYQTKTNDKGFYKIENLKNGTYYIYAFEDKNRNLIVDSKNESYGFLTEKITLSKNKKHVSIPLVRLDARPLKLTSAKPYSNYYNIRLSKNAVTYTIKADPDTIGLISCYGEDMSNIRVYNTFPKSLDSLKIHFQATDSVSNQLDSALYIKFSKKEVKPEKLVMKVDNSTIEANTGILKTNVTFNKPIAEIDFDSIFFQADSLIRINFIETDLEWDFTKNIVTVQKKLDRTYFTKPAPPLPKKLGSQPTPPDSKTNTPSKPAVKNALFLTTASFISIDNDTSKAVKQTPKILREEDTGIIKITIKTLKKDFICQLLTLDYKIVQSVQNKTDITFQNLTPGTYLIRLIEDANSNGKWDAGNYLKKMEPEHARFFKNEKNKDPKISLKANWEVGPLLITYP